MLQLIDFYQFKKVKIICHGFDLEAKFSQLDLWSQTIKPMIKLLANLLTIKNMTKEKLIIINDDHY